MESILYASRRLRRSKPGVELRLIPRKRGRANSLLPGAALRIAETVGFQFLSLRRDGLQNGSADRHQRSEIATTSTSPEQPVVLKTHVSAKLWTPRCQCRARIRCNSTIFWIGPRRELEELSCRFRKIRFVYIDGVTRRGSDGRQCLRTARLRACKAHPSRGKREYVLRCNRRHISQEFAEGVPR
jgi:hypothetical protein